MVRTLEGEGVFFTLHSFQNVTEEFLDRHGFSMEIEKVYPGEVV